MTAAREATSAPGVTRFSAGEGPHLAIIGAIHGNEQCGLSAIRKLAERLNEGALTLRAGSLSLVHGNPAASAQKRRHLSAAIDLNRVFDYRFLDELPPALWEPEHHRAAELRPLLETVDAVLDLHSATAPTPPFAIASRVPASAPFALALGLAYVTFGWDGPGLLGDRVLLGMMTRRMRPGVAVECGQHDDPTAPEVAYGCALRALAHFGLIDPLTAPPPACAPTKLKVSAAVKRPSTTFRFARPLRGMERLEAGDILGTDEHLTLAVKAPCHVIMPNDRVAVGDDVAYLADLLD